MEKLQNFSTVVMGQDGLLLFRKEAFLVILRTFREIIEQSLRLKWLLLSLMRSIE